MNISGVAGAIRARIVGDTGAGGVFETAGTYKAVTVQFVEGPRGANTSADSSLFPYVVYNFVSGSTEEDGFDSDSCEMAWDVHVWDFKQHSNSSAPGAQRSSGMVDRLFGDAIAQSNRVPTYGLHRHQLSLSVTGSASAPWATGVVAVTDINAPHEADFYHWVITLKIGQARAHT